MYLSFLCQRSEVSNLTVRGLCPNLGNGLPHNQCDEFFGLPGQRTPKLKTTRCVHSGGKQGCQSIRLTAPIGTIIFSVK